MEHNTSSNIFGDVERSEHPLDYHLSPKSHEEDFVYILERVGTNSKYQCRFCHHNFSGGNQKIRVHITGTKEGGSSVKACKNPDPDAVAYCSIPRKPNLKRKDEQSAKDRKKTKVNDQTIESASYVEAWNILHTPSKHQISVPGTEAVALDSSGLPIPAPVGQLNPIAPSSDIIARLFDEYGVEKPEDLAFLEPVHLLQLAGFLKLVPRKIFLDLVKLPPPTSESNI